MNRLLVVSLLLLGLLCPVPAAALHARYLGIAIDGEGNATVTFEYTLPAVERFLAFTGAVRPDRDLAEILAATTGEPVEMLPGTPGSAIFRVKGFASVSGTPPASAYATRALNLSWGREGYVSSFLSPLLEPDFSPDETVLRFPDAYSVTFHDQLLIPNITHAS